MPKFQIVRRLVMKEFDNEADALKELHKLYEYETSTKRLQYGDFAKKELRLSDESIIKIIEIKN